MKYYCNGVALDTESDICGTLTDSSPLLGNTEALHARMAQDGYLYFRGLIDRETVLAARQEILLKYAIIGEIDNIDHDVMDGIYRSDSFVDQVNLVAFAESVRTGKAYNDVVMNERLVAFYSDFLGGRIRTFDFKWPRFVRPGETCGLHADVVYVGRGTQNLWSSWIPLGDVSRQEGALVLLEGSHTSDKLDNYWDKDADRDRIGWLSTDPVKLQKSLGGRWLSTDFAAGDVMCFDVRLVHGTFDNNSPAGKARLTSDTRYQLDGDPLDDRWNGDISNPHGGRPKVFLPGLAQLGTNEDFDEEWKPVDSRGRWLRASSTEPAE